MNAAIKIIQELPEQFTRKQVIQCAKKLGYSYSTASGITEKMLYQDLAVRIRNGLYKKLETEELDDELDEFEYEDELEDWEDGEYEYE